jgi:long-chain fatty acid transport protein
MKKLTTKFVLASSTAMLTTSAFATNGDNMMAIGPNARGMGGVGVAAPQDAISAVFANPAAMCFTPGCAYSEVNFAGTLFMPHTTGEVDLQGMPGSPFKADGKQNVYAIPAIGLSVPIDPDTRRWRFGLAAYGATGLGVDYRGTALDQPTALTAPAPPFPAGTKFPLISGEFTSLMIMKFAPSLAYQITPDLSVGAAAHIDYATLDLRNGSSPAYGIGAQLGVLYRPIKHLSLGATYVSPQKTGFENAVDYTDLATLTKSSRKLTLESPNTVAVGVSYSLLDDRLLLEADGKWLNWGSAEGYSDFGWKDQWVAALGAQVAVLPKKLFLRAGYNYGNNPVEAHNGWGAGAHNVQGMIFPDYYYETFRIIGFPAIVEQHATVGIGYAFSEKFELNLAYTHAFENQITETGSLALPGAPAIPARIKSTLSEDSVDFGITWRF